MQEIKQGKIKVLIEIRHMNDSVTECFALTEADIGLQGRLNGAEKFIPVELLSGEVIFIAKSDIKAFKLCETETDEQRRLWSLDPYTILNVTADSSDEEVRETYFALLQKIHPDTVDLEKNHPVFRVFATEITRRVIGAFEYITGERKHRGE